MTRDEAFKRLAAAVGKRASLRKTTDAMRLVNGAGDALPGLVLEKYNAHFCAHVLETAWLKRADWLRDFLSDHFPCEYFILKDRSACAASTPDAFKIYAIVDRAGSRTIVREQGVQFHVDLNDTLNTGLFLDMRANRRLVAGLAKGKRLLNTFAYTCSFGVHARASGAAAVVNVDISKKVLERGRANDTLNGLTPASGEFVRADALRYCERLAKRGERFDVIVVAPPSFARHEGKTFQVKKDMPRLVEAALRVLGPGGYLFVSTNCSALTYADLAKYVKIAVVSRGLKVKGMRALGQDKDFPGSGTSKESHLAAALVSFT